MLLKKLEQRLIEPTIWDAFLSYLSATGYKVPADQLARDITASMVGSEGVQDVLE